MPDVEFSEEERMRDMYDPLTRKRPSFLVRLVYALRLAKNESQANVVLIVVFFIVVSLTLWVLF
ncbi:MAG: hypothetical protein HYT43_02090 [Candidatus Taylorbacteria bacterium]|nr:hypothetical protein [Candidatus Taylorbacteria bacterium]